MLPVVFRSLYASDGFFLTLCSVLLQLSSPFSSPTSTKLLKIQPTYCLAAKGAQANALAMNVHMWGKYLWFLFLYFFEIRGQYSVYY